MSVLICLLLLCFFKYVNYHVLLQTKEKRPRESLLRVEFAHAIESINKDLPEENRLKFLHWDLNKYSRKYITR